MLYYIVLILIVAIFIHKYIQNKSNHGKNNNNNINNINNNGNQNNSKLTEQFEKTTNDESKNINDYATTFDLNNTNFVLNACPITDESNFAGTEYVNKLLLDTQQICPNEKPMKTIDEFHNNFFGFRNMTEQNSSIRQDPVDIMNNIIVNQQSLSNKKIKDIYDKITAGPNINQNTNKCNRQPKFDNVNYDGWAINTGSPGMYNTMNEWTYDNEKVMNGGQFNNNIVAVDPMYEKNLKI